MTNFPAAIPYKKLAPRGGRKAIAELWRDLSILYADGHELKANASRFLRQKPKELAEIYRGRLERFTSRPVLGTALGWYQSAMFRNDPRFQADREDEFWQRFMESATLGGESMVDVAQRAFLNLVLYGEAVILTDLPVVTQPFASRAQQLAAGALDAHVVQFDPWQLVNYQESQGGVMDWALLHSVDVTRSFPGEEKTEDRYYFFDREQCAVYAAERVNGKPAETLQLMEGYPRPHALADAGRVPVRRFTVPDGLWLGNRAYLSVCTYIDIVNALDWGMFNGCLPTLWVSGNYQDDMTRSEVGYIQLPENGDIGYVEPSGGTFQMALEYIGSWREELYRQLYLQAQGRDSAATPSASSGVSKAMDAQPSMDVLNGLADILRAALLSVLRDVADARGDVVEFSITGLDHGEADDMHATERDQVFLDVGLGDTVTRAVKKRIAQRALKDAPQDVVTQALEEIDAMPSDEERQVQRIASAFNPPGVNPGEAGRAA